MTDRDDMTGKELMTAVLRWVFGTDAEMAHPRVQEEAEMVLSKPDDPQPKTREDVKSKIAEAHEAIDQMKESTDRLARFQPAKSLDEALQQLVGERR